MQFNDPNNKIIAQNEAHKYVILQYNRAPNVLANSILYQMIRAIISAQLNKHKSHGNIFHGTENVYKLCYSRTKRQRKLHNSMKHVP